MISDDLFELATQVGAAVNAATSLDEMLLCCAESIVRFLPINSTIISIRDGSSQMAMKGTAGGGVAPSTQEDLHFPLTVDEELIGEIRVVPQTPLTDEITRGLQNVARAIALGVHRKKIEKHLSEREHVFEQFANHIEDLLWIVSPHAGRTVWVSPSCERIYGHTVEEAYKNPHVFMQSMLPEDRERMIKFMEATEALTAESPKKANDLEYRIIRADGELRWLWTRAFPLFNEHGKVYQICGFTHDITERKEAERRVSEFHSTVSHELRTPLTSIRAALGLIEGGVTDPNTDESLELVSIARREADRLIRLINDILDMRKIEAGKLPLTIVALDPSSVVQDTVTAMRGFAHEHEVELVTWINDERKFFGDYDRVVQVLTNLLSNAIKYSPRGRVVTINVDGGFDSRIRFTVADQGPGIPEEQHSKLFGIFHQLDSSDTRERGGTGLGLAISKAIVERLGGVIGFDSKPNKGSTFWFELPLSDKHTLPAVAATSVSADSDDSQPSDGLLRDFIDEYTRLLPARLDSLRTRLKSARTSNDDNDIAECLVEVRKIRASSEPCGFHDVARAMLLVEQALLKLNAPSSTVEPVWRDIEVSLDTAIASQVRR